MALKNTSLALPISWGWKGWRKEALRRGGGRVCITLRLLPAPSQAPKVSLDYSQEQRSQRAAPLPTSPNHVTVLYEVTERENFLGAFGCSLGARCLTMALQTQERTTVLRRQILVQAHTARRGGARILISVS